MDPLIGLWIQRVGDVLEAASSGRHVVGHMGEAQCWVPMHNHCCHVGQPVVALAPPASSEALPRRDRGLPTWTGGA